jgi:hypothetical protein
MCKVLSLKNKIIWRETMRQSKIRAHQGAGTMGAAAKVVQQVQKIFFSFSKNKNFPYKSNIKLPGAGCIKK